MSVRDRVSPDMSEARLRDFPDTTQGRLIEGELSGMRAGRTD